jgi:glycosyltransferase involved in cell wall biosynthesis
MLNGKKIIVVLPAYNAARTLAQTVSELDRQVVDEVLLVDDFSADETVQLAKEMGIRSFLHDRNYGYGRNQKTCYTEAIKSGADVIVMLHPDYQYSPKLVPAIAAMVVSDEYDVVLGSRILGGSTRSGGMPFYKYVANRALTLAENLLLGSKLSEFHTGFRAFSRKVLEQLPIFANSDDFVFDNEMLAQAIYFEFRVGEISCPTRYFPEASSINFRRSVIYGLGVLWTAMRFRAQKWSLSRYAIFDQSDANMRLGNRYYSEIR